MPQPLENALAVTQANMRLALSLADAWRESGQKIIEIGGRGAKEAAEASRAGLIGRLGADSTPSAVPGHLQDYLGEIEALRATTAAQIQEAVSDWRKSVAETMTSGFEVPQAAPFEALMKPWFSLLQVAPDGGAADKEGSDKAL